ncbi:MAG: hypothetical protein RL341_293 [Pseudomonadota bacterium]|jgi:hypothetical protein
MMLEPISISIAAVFEQEIVFNYTALGILGVYSYKFETKRRSR